MDRIGDFSDQFWLDTLAWVGRAEVGFKFALINARFDALVDAHLRQRQWRFDEFHICERKQRGQVVGAEVMTLTSDGSSFITLPLATTPLPDSIIGFKTFNIWYVNEEVIAFLHKVRRLFAKDISLEFSIRFTEFRSWQTMARHIWPLLKDGIIKITNLKKKQLAMLRKHVSRTVLFDCANLHQITSPMLPECPPANASAADDENVVGDTSARDLYTWIHKQRSDGRPVLFVMTKLRKGWDQFVEHLCRTFFVSSTATKYMILAAFPFVYGNGEMTQMVNILTEERLSQQCRTLQLEDGSFMTNVKILRTPAEFPNDEMYSWLRMAKRSSVIRNLVHIGFNDDEIGTMPSESAASRKLSL